MDKDISLSGRGIGRGPPPEPTRVKKVPDVDKQITVWNLICTERYLHGGGDSGRAYNIRKALDLLSSNWRDISEYKEIILNVK
jgi:hypothetical protein